MTATSCPPLDHRIKRLALDLEAVELIRGKVPVLDWSDEDAVLVHSVANMLQNELSVLRGNRRCVQEGARPSLGASVSAKVKAALRLAGHRALSSVKLVFPALKDGMHHHGDGEHGYQESGLERASSSPSVRAAAEKTTDDGSGRLLQRNVRFSCSTDSDDLVMSEGSSVDQGDRAVAVIAGNRMLPLSGTF